MPETHNSAALRLLSYNIQAGVATDRYRQYLTHSWKQVLPHRDREHNLGRIGELIKEFDLVGLQEVDIGSFRSRYSNQVDFLAKTGGFPFCHSQTNRRIGRIARIGLGVLSRLPFNDIAEIKLPGSPGRGALFLRLGIAPDALIIVIVHLALGPRARMLQVNFLGQLLKDFQNLVLMGDFNCPADSDEVQLLCESIGLRNTSGGINTFPSWRPIRNLDHVLVSNTLAVDHAEVLPHRFSDHLPISLTIHRPAPQDGQQRSRTDTFAVAPLTP